MTPPPDGKRVLFVITKASWGGAQRYVYDLALSMRKNGLQVAVAHGTEGVLVEKLAEEGIRTLPLQGVDRDVSMFSTAGKGLSLGTVVSSIQKELRALNELVRLIREEAPDILHVNSSKAGGLGALAGRIAGVKKIIFTAHGWAFNERRPWWQKLLFCFLHTLTLWLSHKTICASEALFKDMEWVPFAHMTVIHHGIDAPAFLSQEASRKQLLPHAHNSYWIGMVAELHPTKRVEDAVDAFSELRNLRPDAILVVMGEGEARVSLENRIKHYGLEERIYLLGFVLDAPKYVKAFDLFLMPSRTEALGLALIEAGYAGLPSIASRVGGMPEIVRHKETGLLVPKENPHALARAIRRLIEHPDEATRYGQALQNRVTHSFAKERMLEDTLAVYGL